MTSSVQLGTKRLVLRQWQLSDYAEFAQMNSNPLVMKYLPAHLSVAESNTLADRCAAYISRNGWGLWAVALGDSQQFIGFVGLSIPRATLPFSPCTEIGWRLSHKYWGMGYATEAAERALEYAFTDVGLGKVVSFTTVHNEPSRNVMRKLGLTNTHNNFPHPSVATNSPLQEHVLYTITREEWLKKQ